MNLEMFTTTSAGKRAFLTWPHQQRVFLKAVLGKGDKMATSTKGLYRARVGQATEQRYTTQLVLNISNFSRKTYADAKIASKITSSGSPASCERRR